MHEIEVQFKCFPGSESVFIRVGYKNDGFVENSNSTTIVNGITWVVYK